MANVRELRESLRAAALREPQRRFHQLYDKLYRPDVLDVAFERACHGGGRPADYGRARLVAEAGSLRRGRLPVTAFGRRVVAEAAALVLEPVLLPRRCFDAWGLMAALVRTLRGGREPVLCLKVFPDWAGHGDRLFDLLRARLADRRLLALVRELAPGLDAAVCDFGRLAVPRLSGGLGSLLAEYQLTAAEGDLGGVSVRAGNEMVLAGAVEGWREVLAVRGLVAEGGWVDPAREGFDFLGLHVRRELRSAAVAWWPAAASAQAMRDRIRGLTSGRTHLDLPVMVASLAGPLAEWGGYYRISSRRAALKKMDRYVRERLAVWNARKHGLAGFRAVSRDALRGLGLIELGALPPVSL